MVSSFWRAGCPGVPRSSPSSDQLFRRDRGFVILKPSLCPSEDEAT
jgi:hypothetical protein